MVEITIVPFVVDKQASVNGNKPSQGKEKPDAMGEASNSPKRAKKKEKDWGDTSKTKHYQRHINLQDFPLGHGMASYNLIEDL